MGLALDTERVGAGLTHFMQLRIVPHNRTELVPANRAFVTEAALLLASKIAERLIFSFMPNRITMKVQ